MRLPDPQRTWLLLVGTATRSADGSLPALPAVSANLGSLLDVLTRGKDATILPRHALMVRDPSDPAVVEEALLDLADRDADTVLFYFAGHGLLDDVGDLHLATSRSSRQRPQLRSLHYDVVRRTLAGARARNRVVILDCCYSGRAITAMGSGQISGRDVEVSGSYTLTSTSANRTAHAPAGERYTAFTGALLDVLRDGEPDGPELVDMTTLYQGVSRRLRAAGRPPPQQQNTETVAELALVRNPARKPKASPDNLVVPRRRAPELTGWLPGGRPDLRPESPTPALQVAELEGGGPVLGACFMPDGAVTAVVAERLTVQHNAEGGPRRTSRLARRVMDRTGLARVHVATWAPDGERTNYPPLPLPHSAITFKSVMNSASGGTDAAIVLSAGTWYQIDLHSGTTSGPSRQAMARSLLPGYLHAAGGSQAAHWDVSIDGGPILFVYLSLIALNRMSTLLIVDLRTNALHGRIPIDVSLGKILHLQTLPGRLAALVVNTGDKRQPLRRLMVDLGECRLIADDPIATDPVRRFALTTAALPRFSLSDSGDHIAVSTLRAGRTVIYAVNGRGTASNVPGTHVGWSPAGSTLAVCKEATMTILDVDARAEVLTLELPTSATADPVFSPDGTRIAAAAGEQILVIDGAPRSEALGA
jgi:hypothetical protein